MPIQYPTEIELTGPWLLEDESLLQLEQILEDEWSRLESRRKSLIENEANDKVQDWERSGLIKNDDQKKEKFDKFVADPSYELVRSNRNINLSLKNKGIYPTNKFSSVLRDNSLLNEVITGFSIDLVSADIRCRVNLKSWSNELVIDVSPETTNEAREIFVSLRNWAEKNSPPYWQKLWGKLHDVIWLLWFLLVVFGFFAWSVILSSSTANAKQRARDLLDKGITQQNSIEAIELLLILQTDYDPTVQPISREVPAWLKIIFWSGLALNILLSFRSKTPLLGIGKGRRLISNWKTWYRLVGITIPGLIFASFIWPILVEWIYKLIN